MTWTRAELLARVRDLVIDVVAMGGTAGHEITDRVRRLETEVELAQLALGKEIDEMQAERYRGYRNRNVPPVYDRNGLSGRWQQCTRRKAS